MAVSLIVNELTYQSTLVMESHLSFPDPLILHELSLIDVTILKELSSSPIPLGPSEVTFIVLPVCILNYTYNINWTYKYLDLPII